MGGIRGDAAPCTDVQFFCMCGVMLVHYLVVHTAFKKRVEMTALRATSLMG